MPCKAAEVLAAVAPADRATLQPLLDPELGSWRVPATVLSKALGNLGLQVSPTTIKDHRGARCVCRREA